MTFNLSLPKCNIPQPLSILNCILHVCVQSCLLTNTNGHLQCDLHYRMYAKFEYVCCVTCISKIVFHLDNLGWILCLNDLIFIIELMQSG